MGFLKSVFEDKEVLEASRTLLLTVLRVTNAELDNCKVEVASSIPEPEVKEKRKGKSKNSSAPSDMAYPDTTAMAYPDTTAPQKKDAPVVLPMLNESQDDIPELDDNSDSEMEELPVDSEMTLEQLTEACKKIMNESKDLAVFRKDFSRCLQVYKVKAVADLPKGEYKSFLALVESNK